MRTILLSCLLLAFLANYTPYAEGGITPTGTNEPASASEAETAIDPTSGTEDGTVTEIEAPEAVFELDIGDADVDFFLEGVWRASVLGSFGLLIGPDGTQLSSFPGLDTGRFFRQMPDLTFSVWLLDRFFVEASVIGDFLQQDYEYFDQNYILMGYLGAEGEFLRRVLIGSKDVTIDPFPYIDVPEPGKSSLGVEAVMGTGMSEHQMLLRYDNNEPGSLTYIGGNLVSEQVIALDDYIRGRFFKLPDAAIDAGTLEVYIEDENGSFSDTDGRKYRRATVEDATIDRAGGTVFLKRKAEGNVLVYYEIGPAAIGDSSLGGGALAGEDLFDDKIDLSQVPADFEWDLPGLYLGEDLDERKVTVDGKLCLRLYRPEEFSPFEILAGYALEETVPDDLSRLRVGIVRKGSLNRKESTEVAFQTTPGEDFIQAYYTPAPGLRDDFRNLYPFLDTANPDPPFDPENLLYGPLADAKPGYLGYEILVSRLTPVSLYQIGSEVVPGSVQILRNGITETRFEVDYDTGVITFLTEIFPDDRLSVSFRRKSSLVNNGDVLFAWGNTLNFSEALNLELATGVRWNFLPGTYTEEAYSRTGSVVVSAAVDGTVGPLEYETSVGASFTNPDTTGIMRLLGMESTGLDISLSEELAYPARPPVDSTIFSLGFDLDAAHRGVLKHDEFAYTDGGKPGPYLSGDTLVAEFNLDNLAADNAEWVGFQLPAAYGQGVMDFSSFDGISLSYGALNVSNNIKIYIQIGEIGEDLDDDDELDRELTESAAGFEFDDSSNSAVLKVGSGPENSGNGFLDTEDIDGNGFLDPEDDQNIITTPVENVSATAVAGQVERGEIKYTFTAAEKDKLRRTRSIRILIADDPVDLVGTTGKLLIDRISLVGSRFHGDNLGTALTVDAEEIAEPRADPQLEASFPDTFETFHPFGEQQKVLEVSWSAAGDWEVKGYTEATPEGIDYRNIIYYYRFPTADGDPLSFSLTDSEGKGIHWSFTPFASTDWSEIRVSLEDRKVYSKASQSAAPVEIASSTLTQDEGYGSLNRFTIKLENTTAADGTLYIDELHLTDPAGSLGAAATVDLQLSLPGELVTWGAHPLIHDLSFRQQAAYASKGFSRLYGTPLEAQSYSSVSEVDVGISLADVNADFSVAGTITDTERLVTVAGGHGLTVPNISSPVVFSESFSLRERDTGTEIQRGNSLTLNPLPLARLELESQAGSLEKTLNQSWDVDLRISPTPFSLQNSLSISGAVDDFVLGPDGYFSNWIYGYALLFPYPVLSGWDSERWPAASQLERKANLDLNWDLDTAPIGLQTTWRHGFQSYDFAAAERTLNSSADMELSVPFRLLDNGISLFSVSTGYRRHLDVIDPETGVGDYSEDFLRSFQTIYGQQYLYSQFPYVELYSASAEQQFLERSDALDRAEYSAEAYVQFSRRFSSRIRDLFLPSFFELSAGKQFVKDQDLTDLYNSYTLTTQSTALNLFGNFGAFPLFPFYRTDEFSSSLSLIAEVDDPASGPPLRGLEMSLDHFVSFEGDGQLSLDNRLSLRQEREDIGPEIQWEDSAKILYLWNRYPEKGVRLPLLPERIGEKGYFAHRESLALELNGPKEDSSYHPFNLILNHESTAVLPDYGQISAEISAGIDLENTSGGQRYWRLGLSGGINVQIEF